MPVTSTTPLMNLVLPTVGPTGQIGPTWATNLNDAFNLVDAHDHTSGKGPKVPTAGLSINADLSFGGFNATSLNTSKYNSLVSALASSFTNSVYVVGGELYFNDGSGTDVQLTSGGAINVASLGTITGDYSTSTADLNYSDATKTFTFKQSATATAFISCGSVSIFENVAGAKFTKIQNTASQASDQTITLWASLPGSTLPALISSSGVLSTGQITTAQITDVNVTTAKIADLNVTTAKIADSNVTTAKIADLNVTQAKLQARPTGSSVAAGGFANNATISFSTSSTTFVDVTNATVTIVTTGRPVVIGLIAADGTTDASLTITNSTTANMNASFRIVRDATNISRSLMTIEKSITTVSRLQIPPTSIYCVDLVSAGTYVYKLQTAVNTGTTTVDILSSKFFAYEI